MTTDVDVLKKLEQDTDYQQLLQALNHAKRATLEAEANLVHRAIKVALELKKTNSGIVLP